MERVFRWWVSSEDGKYESLTEDPHPAMFLPILQSPSSETCLVVRSARSATTWRRSIRNTLQGLDTGLPVLIETWSQELN